MDFKIINYNNAEDRRFLYAYTHDIMLRHIEDVAALDPDFSDKRIMALSRECSYKCAVAVEDGKVVAGAVLWVLEKTNSMFLEHVSSLPEYKDVLPAFLDYVVTETPKMMPSLTGLYTEVTKRQMFLSSTWRGCGERVRVVYTTPARIDKGLPERGDVYLLRLYGKDCVYPKDLKVVLREYFTLAYIDTENIEDCLSEIGDEDVIQLRRVS